MNETTSCTIEHHAILFALLAKHTITRCKEAGLEAVLHGVTLYGNERGARMAAQALAHGDELNTLTNQAYGEWKPDYDGQMDCGILGTRPALRTYVKKCAWCDAWNKHGLSEYGKYYCVNIDHAVYQGFRSDLTCTPTTTALSWGGSQCEFDWEYPLSDEDMERLNEKKRELGTSCMKDFTFHTAHLLHTIGKTIKEQLLQAGEEAVGLALSEYIERFGREYADILGSVNTLEF